MIMLMMPRLVKIYNFRIELIVETGFLRNDLQWTGNFVIYVVGSFSVVFVSINVSAMLYTFVMLALQLLELVEDEYIALIRGIGGGRYGIRTHFSL